MPRPRLRTSVPRRRPSVGFMVTTRTRLSPICWATSATTVTSWPSTSRVISRAWLISGSEPRGNSTSTTGPAMATTRPAFSSVVFSVTVIGGGGSSSRRSVGPGRLVQPVEVFGECVLGGEPARHQIFLAALVRAQGLGAADDLHDLGGDGVLAGPVEHAGEGDGEVVGVVGRRLHR